MIIREFVNEELLNPPLPAGIPMPIDAERENRPVVSIGCISNVYIRQMHFTKAGNKNVAHTHNHDHATLLGSGSVECSVDGQKTIFKAPAMIYIIKDKLHFFTALEDNTMAYCIHALRDKDGDNDIISPESVPAGVSMYAMMQKMQTPANEPHLHEHN